MIAEERIISTENEVKLEKLVLEVKELKYRNSLFNRLIAPFLSLSFLTICLGTFSLLIQTKNQESQRFTSFIEQATTAEKHQGRIAGIWMLNSYWDSENNSDSNKLVKKITGLFVDEVALYKPIANTLSAIVASDENNNVRLAAAEVIGNAYQSDWQVQKLKENSNPEVNRRVESLRFLLYGNGTTGENGTLTWANQGLRKTCNKENDPVRKQSCQDKLYAVNEAIRKNWENLENVNLSETDLSKTPLYKANLKRANLARAILRGTKFVDANLIRVNLINADLTEADLRGANLEKAVYNKGTKFVKVKWSGDFNDVIKNMYAIEPESKLIDSDLQELPLQGANLERANLLNADLRKSNLSRANLKGANLNKAKLDEAIFKEAKYDKNTIFPDGFDPKAAEMIEVK